MLIVAGRPAPQNGAVPPELHRLLADDLAAAAFTTGGLEGRWGADASAALHRGDRVPASRASGTDALGALARALVLGEPLEVDALGRALPSLGVDGAAALGLIEVDGGVIRPLLDLRPYAFVDDAGAGEWWIASDLGELTVGGPLRRDHVLGVGGASTTLSGLMIREPVDRVLDLGTGCGIQAMHASRHAREVIATDVSARALELAGFNAALNRIPNIGLRRGSLFDPVAGERFDRIVSNPPFVITPRDGRAPRYEYRDGGLSGDDLVAAVVGGAADHLERGGVAQLLGNWEYRDGIDGLERVRGWVDASADHARTDAWVIEREVQDPALYAETWIRDGGQRPGPDFDALVGAWLDDFAGRDVVSVGFGWLTLRRRADEARPIRRFERMPGPVAGGVAGLGAHLAAGLAASDAERRVDDAALAGSRLRVAADVTEERHYWPGAEHPTVMTLRQGGGFGRSWSVGTELAAVVGACDGDLPLGAIVGAVAELLGGDADAVARGVLPRVRELVRDGALLLPDAAG